MRIAFRKIILLLLVSILLVGCSSFQAEEKKEVETTPVEETKTLAEYIQEKESDEYAFIDDEIQRLLPHSCREDRVLPDIANQKARASCVIIWEGEMAYEYVLFRGEPSKEDHDVLLAVYKMSDYSKDPNGTLAHQQYLEMSQRTTDNAITLMPDASIIDSRLPERTHTRYFILKEGETFSLSDGEPAILEDLKKL